MGRKEDGGVDARPATHPIHQEGAATAIPFICARIMQAPQNEADCSSAAEKPFECEDIALQKPKQSREGEWE